VILHTLKDDDPIARRFDLVIEHPEFTTDAKLLDLLLDQALGGLSERLLDLANTDRQHAFLIQALLDDHLAEEMGLPRAAAAPCALVARGLEQRLEHRRGWDLKRGQW
jgi:hypothetical protein